MNLKPEQLGKNIRKARQDHNMTQVGLADLLNVSESAVSQWESGKTSPDLGIIPEICAILDISADWLLDVGSEKRNREINDICARANLVADAGREDEAAEILREGLKRFPSSEMIIYNLMLYSHDDNEVIELGEWILNNSKNDQYHNRAVNVLSYSYREVGNREKAEELARSLPKLFGCSDMVLLHVFYGEKALRHSKKLLYTLLEAMSAVISNICIWAKKTGCTCDIDILTTEKYIALIELMFEKGDYGYFNDSLGFDYLELAMKSAKDRDKDSTLSYLSKATDCIMDFLDYAYNPDFKHSSLLFEGLPWGKILANHPDNSATDMLGEYNLGNSVFDFVRDTEEFKVLIDRLSSVAGKWDAERMESINNQNWNDY